MEKKVLAYIRVSKLPNDYTNHESQDMQLNQIRDFCKQNKLTLIENGVYKDLDKSGSNILERKQFQKMFWDLKNKYAKGEINGIVVYNLSRFSRNLNDITTYLEELDNLNIAFYSCKENFIDFTTPAMRRFVLSIFGAIVELQREQISEYVKNTMWNMAESGKHTGSYVPFGYIVDPETKKYIIDENKANIVRYIFKRYLLGINPAEIANELKIYGDLDSKRKFNATTIREILKNVKYTGKWEFGKTSNNVRQNKVEKNPREMWIEKEKNHPAIITLEEFEQVQKEMTARRVNKNERNEDDIDSRGEKLLTGVIRCGYCNSKYYASPSVTRGITYNYYKCNGPSQNGKSSCIQAKVRSIQIEELVFQAIEEIIESEYLKELFKEEYDLLRMYLISQSENRELILSILTDLEREKNFILKKIIRLEKESSMLEHRTEIINELYYELDSIIGQIMRFQNDLEETNIKFDILDIPKYEDFINVWEEQESYGIQFLQSLHLETIRKAIRHYIDEIIITDIGNSKELK
ncbi:hypothetical protein BCM0079_0493 [Bacillus cereus]|uniref:recombinase family protein n=1 Tax=Bacillus cereus TaxID=1396 RepID=UPI001F31C2A4|nr:recombinase family protein [Bacillus cereus]BCC21900.1 hypothetical protein BCM0079_0493 [Bacillus cereus]